MSAAKIVSSIGPLLRTLVEETPGVSRAIVHTDKGWPIVSMPSHSFYHSAKTAFAVPGLLRRAGEFHRKIKVENHDCVVAELPNRTLLIIPLSEMCLTIDVSQTYDLRSVRSGITRIIDNIARVLVEPGGH